MTGSPSIVRIGVGAAGLLVLLAAFGFVEGVGPPAATLLAWFGSDYLLAATLGGCAVVVAAAAFVAGARTGDRATVPEVERPTPVEAPGEAFTRQLSGGVLPIVTPSAREEAVQRLRRTAVRTVVAVEGCQPPEAERRVANGSWTDDPVAADLLRRDTGPPPLPARIAALGRGETWLAHAADRTVEAIVARREGAPAGEGDDV